MNVNKPFSPPQNNEAAFRPINGKNATVYWGGEQILTDGVYSPAKFPTGAPIQVPKVARFLYAYKETDEPVELDVVGCGCPTTGDCATTLCDWVQLGTKVAYVGLRMTQAASDNGYVFAASFANIALPTDEAQFWLDPTLYDGSTLTIWVDNSFTVKVYEGPTLLAPPEWLNIYWLNYTLWELSCVSKVTGDPVTLDACPQRVFRLYASFVPQPDLTCDYPAIRLEPFGTFQNSNGTYTTRFREPVDHATDYADYDTSCVPGPSPCEEE